MTPHKHLDMSGWFSSVFETFPGPRAQAPESFSRPFAFKVQARRGAGRSWQGGPVFGSQLLVFFFLSSPSSFNQATKYLALKELGPPVPFYPFGGGSPY